MKIVFVGAAAIAAAGVLGNLVPRPSAAVPMLRPDFSAVICHAEPPKLSHAWAQGIQVVPPGAVRPIAEKVFSNEDNADLMFKLGLLEGHLLVGRELIQADQLGLALPHFGHPVRELYDDISESLKERGITGFDSELIALEALAAGTPTAPATMSQFGKVMRILAAVRATVPAGLRDDERFMSGVLADVAETAASDFNESIQAGRITKPVEYHDSHGYLLYADQELARLQGRPGGKGSNRLQAVRRLLTQMQGIVGPLMPSDTPAGTVADYRKLVAEMRKAASE